MQEPTRPASLRELDAARPAPRGTSVWGRRRAALLGWQVAGLALGAGLLAAAIFFLPASNPVRIFTDTLTWGWLAMLGSVVLLDVLVSRQAYLHVTVALVSVACAFGGLLVWFVATHATYSRWAIVCAAVYALVVHAHAWHRWRRRTALRLGVIDEAMMERVAPASRFPSDASAIERCEWVFVPDVRVDTAFDGLIDGVVLPDGASAAMRQGAALRAKLAGTQVYSESFMRAMLTGRLDIERADEVFLDDVPVSVAYATFKRLLDILGGLLLAAPGLPLVLLAMLAVRLESPGSPLLVQPRVGLRGRAFAMYKLRTMHVRHDASAEPRITRVGHWLRRTRVDELPQLWNVLRGEMSLIGPRPEWTQTAAELERRIPQFAFRYLVRPGITGWAQVHQGHVTGESDVRTKLSYDLYYAKNMSLPLDLAITMLTIRTVLTGRGAR
jgi:lipopolysaccharide/colanic/teichoic acid biosynthesis glycosyltransferase